jgi:hypothetical protein
MSTGAYAWAVVCYWVLVVERTTRLPFGKHLLALAVAAFGAQAIQNVIAVGVGWCLMIFALGQGAKVATDRPKPAITFEKLAARAARKDA